VNKAAQGRYNGFDEFWPDFLAAISLAKSNKTTGAITKLLNRQAGFVPNEAQAKQVYQCIRELPNSDALQFALFVLARTKPLPSRVVSALGDQIWSDYKHVAAFPDIEQPTWVDVREWISGRISKAIAERQDVLRVGRSMFAFLLRMRERDFYPNALLLLADQIGGNKRKKGESAQNEIEVIVAELLARPKLNRKQVALIGRSGRTMRDVLEAAIAQRRQDTARLESHQQEMVRLQAQLKEKGIEVDERTEALTALRAQLSAAQEDVAAAQGRVAGTEEHWSVISKQQLAGTVSKLRGEIEHETKEIVLCLDRAAPNTDMALQRARRIEKILQKANSTQ
jgi:hypothetical protein